MTSGGAAHSASSARSKRPRKSGTSTSILVRGDNSRTARIHCAKCSAPPSRKSSRSTLVMTTYLSRSAAMVSARWRGSSASGGLGRPCATSQNGQRRVHRSPKIMNVAVPLPKHSPIFGQEASSQTVWSFFSRSMRLISPKRSPPGARTRIHSGLRSGVCGTILMGIRAVLSAPFCFSPVELTYPFLSAR